MKKQNYCIPRLFVFVLLCTTMLIQSCSKTSDDLSVPLVDQPSQPRQKVPTPTGGVAILQIYKNQYLHKADQNRSQVAAYVTAYNSINNTAKTLGEIGTEKQLSQLAGWWTNGGVFYSQSSTAAGKQQMFNKIVDAILQTGKPVVVYGKGSTGVMGGLIVCAIDGNADYSSTDKNIRYTDLRIADATTSGDRFSANVKSMAVKTFIDNMATTGGVLNAITW